jgi:hypothetical protein
MDVFHKRGLLSGVLSLFSASCRTPGEARRTSFSYSSDIGVAVVKSGKACLEIHNASVSPGSKVSLVGPTVPQSTSDAVVIGRADDACPTIDQGDTNLNRYEIRTAADSTLSSEPAIAILGPVGPFARVDKLMAADMDQDGRQEFFRSCTSAEGIHFTVWSGRPLEGARRWHQYYYLGYDVTPDCTQLDVESKQ